MVLIRFYDSFLFVACENVFVVWLMVWIDVKFFLDLVAMFYDTVFLPKVFLELIVKPGGFLLVRFFFAIAYLMAL